MLVTQKNIESCFLFYYILCYGYNEITIDTLSLFANINALNIIEKIKNS